MSDPAGISVIKGALRNRLKLGILDRWPGRWELASLHWMNLRVAPVA